jgi:hypothetical protein
MARTGRPTTYRGIQMRSRLEADFAAWLDRTGQDWAYEPKCFAGSAGQWLPDFEHRRGGLQYIELKPYERSWESKGQQPDYTTWMEIVGIIEDLITRVSVAWESEPDAHLMIVFWRYGGQMKDALLVAAGPEDRVWTFNFGGNGIAGIVPTTDQFYRLSAVGTASSREMC